ncbi:MAG: hypothetical protein ABWY05_18035 [Noviherbaspirillum sp.]
MLNIKDLASSKELGASEMSAVRGGSNFNVGNHNVAHSSGFASPAAVIAPVTQVDATSKIDNTLLQNFGGFQFAAVR